MSEGCRLFVGNLSYHASEDDVRDAFQKFEPSEVTIRTHRSDGRSRRFGFISLPTQDQAKSAKSEMNGYNLLGKKLRVNDATKKSEGGGGSGYRDGDRGGYQNRNGGYNQIERYNGGESSSVVPKRLWSRTQFILVKSFADSI